MSILVEVFKMNKNQSEKYVNDYLNECKYRKRLNYNTIRAYTIDLMQFARYVDYDLLNLEKVKEFVYELNKKYTKYRTIKRKIASIKAFYMYLEDEELIEFSPFQRVKFKSKEPKELPKIVSNEILHKVFDYLFEMIENPNNEYQKRKAIQDAAVVEMLLSMGLRVSELCNIQLNDINLKERTLKIQGKGLKERILYIGNESLIDLLNMYYKFNMEVINEQNYFFVNKFGKRMTEQSVRIILNSLEKKLKLSSHLTPHMFRHTFATMLLDNGVDIRYIQKFLGHSSIAITQIYTHVSYAKQKEILSSKNPLNEFVK